MKKLNRSGSFIFLLITFCFCACEPGYYGTTFVANNTSYPLVVTFTTNRMDTIIPVLGYETKQIYAFGDLGSGRDYDCCSCEFLSIFINGEDTAVNVVKVISDVNNWELINENKGKYSSKDIICTFSVDSVDIQ